MAKRRTGGGGAVENRRGEAGGDEAGFDLVPTQIRFVIHRQATPRWAIHDISYSTAVTIALAVQGRAHYRCGGESARIGAGQMLLFDAGVLHSATADAVEPWRFYSVAFDVSIEGGRGVGGLGGLPWNAPAENRVRVEALFAELESRWAARERGYQLRCRAIVLTLLHLYVEAATRRAHTEPHAEQLIRVARYLQEHYDQTFHVGELAARSGLSESRFRVLFKKTVGSSVVRYQNSLRVNRARSLLLSGEHTVAEAAGLVGIGDVYYFSRMFKKVTGVNPSSLIPR